MVVKKAALKPLMYVGVGASAGGLEAIEAFFSNMPTDTGMAFVVVQHLSPDYKSLMVELLSKKTKLKVLRAEDQMLVEPNSVYLIPPKKNMTIFHQRLILTDQKPGHGLNLPIDIFFHSLAQDQGLNSAAVVLSGTGSDGMRGIKSIKEAGGIILVQSQESAKFDGMPRSAISTGLADFVLPPEEMPCILYKCCQNRGKLPSEMVEPQRLDHENIARIFSLLRGRTGVDFTFYKPSTILRRLERRMNLNQIHELGAYTRYLENYPNEVNQLYKELLIGVTSFFRDPEYFDFIYGKVIPEIFSGNNSKEIRVWVSGCSTGEEAYSLGMLFSDYLETCNRFADIKIFATDIDKEAIQYAGNGVYPESSAAEIGQSRVLKYFQHRGDRLHVVRSLREMVVFAQHNLVKDPPFTNIDLVSCRNLLIYLQPVLQKKSMQMFQFALKPDGKGFLMLGNSETPGEIGDGLIACHNKLRIFKTSGEKKMRLESDCLANFVRKSESRGGTFDRGKNAVLQPDERVLDRLLQSLSDNFQPLVILVNDSFEVLYLAGDATGILSFPSGKMNHDIQKLVCREISIPVMSGIQKALKNSAEVTYTNIKIKERDLGCFDLLVRPLAGKKNQEKLLAVVFRQANRDHDSLSAKAGQTFDLNQETEQRIADLEQELQFTKENLQATIEELETSNEELQATNEELLSSNEELQSTNEELQSVNEELFTVNSEHQQKIIELTELNNDIDNLLMATDIGTIFLDENLEIRKFTPYVNRVIKVLEQDVGRPFAHLSHHVGNINLMEIVERVTRTLTAESVEYYGADKKWYLIKVLPYKISPKSVSGIVISFIDINQVKAYQQNLQRETALLSLTGEITGIGGWEIDLEKNEIYWSRQIYNIYKVSHERRPDDVAGQMSFYPKEAQAKLEKALECAKIDGSAFALTLPFENAEKEKLWVRILGRGHKKEGRVVKIQGTFQDVTEQYLNDLSEKRSRKILAAMLDWNDAQQSRSLELICRQRVEFLVKEAGFAAAWIALADRNNPGEVHISAAAGKHKDKILQVSDLKLKAGVKDKLLAKKPFAGFSKVFKNSGKKSEEIFAEQGLSMIWPVSTRGRFFGVLGLSIPAEMDENLLEIQILAKFVANLATGFYLKEIERSHESS